MICHACKAEGVGMGFIYDHRCAPPSPDVGQLIGEARAAFKRAVVAMTDSDLSDAYDAERVESLVATMFDLSDERIRAIESAQDRYDRHR